jgi:hypothetical protein
LQNLLADINSFWSHFGPFKPIGSFGIAVALANRASAASYRMMDL